MSTSVADHCEYCGCALLEHALMSQENYPNGRGFVVTCRVVDSRGVRRRFETRSEDIAIAKGLGLGTESQMYARREKTKKEDTGMSDHISEGKYQESVADPPEPATVEAAMGEPSIVSIDQNKDTYTLRLSNGYDLIVPRVTSALDVLNKPALMWWAANEEREYCVQTAVRAFLDIWPSGASVTAGEFRGDEFKQNLVELLGKQKAFQKKSTKAKDIGSEVHNRIQWVLMNEVASIGLPHPTPPLSTEASEIAFMAWDDWRKAVNFEPIMTEERIGSIRMRTGGTVDAVGSYLDKEGNPRVGVFDWKSSKRSKSAPDGIYFEHEVQASVYRQILVDDGRLPNDATAGIVRLPKTMDDPVITEPGSPIDWKIIEPVDAHKLAQGFEHIVKTWEFLSANGK